MQEIRLVPVLISSDNHSSPAKRGERRKVRAILEFLCCLSRMYFEFSRPTSTAKSQGLFHLNIFLLSEGPDSNPPKNQ